MVHRKYPGRNRVIARQDAATYIYDQEMARRVQDERIICVSPVTIHAIGLPSGILAPDRCPIPVEMKARCRKCAGCLEHKRRLWTARALEECRVSTRTWFGTLTVRPEDRFRLRCKADLAAQKRGWEPLNDMDPQEAFRKVVDEHNREITTFIKRVRKETEAPLRYLLVSEKHKTGDPHFHLLLHEQGTPVRKECLERQWKLGFTSWRLCDEKASFYVCKYLAKDAQTRIRASVRYGQPETIMRAFTERLQEATRHVSAGANAVPPPVKPVPSSKAIY